MQNSSTLAQLEGVLPHAPLLLLLHAASVGHLSLLEEVLAKYGQHTMASDFGLQAYDSSYTLLDPCRAAALAAVRNDQLAAMEQLLRYIAVDQHDDASSTVCLELLHVAVSSNAAGCAAALISQCEAAAPEQLMTLAVEAGSAASVTMLLERWPKTVIAGHATAVALGRLRLLPLLEQGGSIEGAQHMCDASLSCSCEEEAAEHLPVAMLLLATHPDVGNVWKTVLTSVIQRNCVSTLSSIWDSLSSTQYNGMLACCCLEAVAATHRHGVAAARFVLQHAVPAVQDKIHNMAQTFCGPALLQLLECGHLELLQLVQPQTVTDELVATSARWATAIAKPHFRRHVCMGHMRPCACCRQADGGRRADRHSC